MVAVVAAAAGMSSNRALHPHLNLSRIDDGGVGQHHHRLARSDNADRICNFFVYCSFARPA